MSPTNNQADHSPLTTHHSPLTTYERLGLFALMLTVAAFGVLVEIRSAFLRRHMTDLNVYLRAAWAVRAGEDIYDVVDDNRWHYQYPPLFAILLTPLANPPPGVERGGMPPFAVSAAVWYVFNIGCLWLAVHWLAETLEQRRGTSTNSARRRWPLRLVPILVCIVPTGHTLMRGQVSLLLLLLLCGCAAALERNKPVRAGLWMAAAICLKIIPALLVLLPLGRRDGRRWLAGCALGLVIGLGIIPVAVFGWPRTVQYYVEYDRKVLRPGLGDEGEQARARELTDTVSTDSQSLLAMLHNTSHLDRATRPRNASALLRRWHWAGGLCLLFVTLIAAWRGSRATGRTDTVVFLGALIFNMLILSPVCHLHYFCLMIPLVMGLLAVWQEERGTSTWIGVVPVFCSIHLLTGLLPAIPGLELLRDIGLATWGALPLWLIGCGILWRGQTQRALGFASSNGRIAA